MYINCPVIVLAPICVSQRISTNEELYPGNLWSLNLMIATTLSLKNEGDRTEPEIRERAEYRAGKSKTGMCYCSIFCQLG